MSTIVLCQWAESWFRIVVNSSWQTAALAVVVLAAVTLGRKWPAPVRYALLLVALTKFVIPPFGLGSVGVFSLAKPVEIVTPVLSSPSQLQPMTQIAVAPPRLTAPEAKRTSALSWKACLLLVHVTGTLVVMAWYVGQLMRLRTSIRSADSASDPALLSLFHSVAGQMGVRELPRLMITRNGGPIACGLVMPAILIPSALAELPAKELRIILGHELAHIRRRDLWTNSAQLIITTLWWFHPLLWVLNRSIRSVREDCCDDLLLSRNVTTSSDYCEGLVCAARKLTALPFESTVVCAEKLHPLGRRITRLMDDRIPRWARVSTLSLVGVILLGFVTLPGLRSQEQTNTRPVAATNDQTLQGKSDSEYIKSIVYRGDSDQRRKWQSLGSSGIRMLSRALNSPQWERETRMCVASLLCDLANNLDPDAKIAVPSVLSALKTEPEDSVRGIEFAFFERTFDSLSGEEKSVLLAECLDAMQSRDSSVRHNALISLQRYPKQADTVVPVIAASLKDPDLSTRMMAAKTLFTIDPETAAKSNVVSILVESLSNLLREHDYMGVSEVSLLCRLPELAIPTFIQGVQSDFAPFREKSASALGGFGKQAKAAVPVLRKALNDSDAEVRKQAAAALKKIEPDAATDTAPSASQSWRTNGINNAAVEALNAGPPQVWIEPAKNIHYGNQLARGDNGRLMGRNTPFSWLLANAYRKTQVWMVIPVDLLDENQGYDYVASLPQGSTEALQKEINKFFGVSVRWEIRETNVMILRAAKAGAHGIKPPTPNPTTEQRVTENTITWYSEPLSPMLDNLERWFYMRPIIDQTGLTGRYDYSISWDARWYFDHRGNTNGLSEVLLDQLGLEITPSREKIEMLVVERTK